MSLGGCSRDGHGNRKDEGRAEVLTLRENINRAAVMIDYLLAYVQAHADPVDVFAVRPLYFAEKLKEVDHFVFLDPAALVHHAHLQLLLAQVILGHYLDLFAPGELKRVLGQVDQHLFKVDLVAY